MSPVGIFGYGSHGADIEAIWMRVHPVEMVRLYDEDPTRKLPTTATEPCYLGMNWPDVRRAAAERLGLAAPPALVDQTAVIGPGCNLADGVVIAPNVVLLRDVKVGAHAHVNYGSTMTRCQIGAYTTICPGVTLCGDVTIGEGVLVGCGAIVKNLVTIGDRAVIGAGAVVIEDVSADATVMGMPAKRQYR